MQYRIRKTVFGPTGGIISDEFKTINTTGSGEATVGELKLLLNDGDTISHTDRRFNVTETKDLKNSETTQVANNLPIHYMVTQTQ